MAKNDETLLELLIATAYRYFKLSEDAPQRETFTELNNPKVGDYVMEIGTIEDRKYDIYRIGELLRVETDQPYVIHAIRTLPKGREYGWENARLIKIAHDAR